MCKVIDRMVQIYGLENYCFMGYPVSTENYFTYHHCLLKKCEGGPRTVENGAVLTKEAHTYLNVIEKTEIDIYQLLNSILIEINLSHAHPTINHWRRINELLKEFERLHGEDLNFHHEKIIKSSYQKRLTIV